MSKQQNTTNFRRSPNEALVVKKRVKGRWLQFFAVVLLISQLFVSSLLPAYQVFAETTDASTTTSTAPATASSQTKVPTAETTESPAATEESKEAVDMEQVKAKLLQTISQFGDIKGTTITVTDKKITIELSALISEHAEEIKTAITPLIPEGYAAELTAKQELTQLTSLDQLPEADLASPIEVTWSHSGGTATYTGTKVFPTSFSIALKSTADGRTITWKKGDVIKLPNLTYAGAYGTVTLQPNFVKTTIAGMGYVEGNTITITTDDNGAARPISFSNLKTSSFTNLPSKTLTTATQVTASFLGSSVNFTAVDQSASWNGQIGETIDVADGAGDRDLGFHYIGKLMGEQERDLTYGGSYDDAYDLIQYINRVNDDESGNYTEPTKESTMEKLANTTGNIYMVNTYPNTDGKILDVIGSNLYTRSGSGKVTGMTPDGKQAMIGGDASSSIYIIKTTPHIFPAGTTSDAMKAALAVGETGYSKQADGSIISMVNLGDYSTEENHISYRDISLPNSLWTGMIANQHMSPAAGFDASAYHAKMIAADGTATPPLFSAAFYSTVIVEDPSDGKTTYPIISTIEGKDGPISGIVPADQKMKMNPVIVDTTGLAAIKIAYKSGSTTVGPTKTIYAEPNTTLSSYMENNSTEKLFPESFVMGPITYKLKENPVTENFGDIGSTVTINVEYEPQATIQLDYQSDGKTIAPSKLIYAGEQTSLTDYLTNHVNDKLLPEEIKVGTTVYRLIDFDATPYKFGAGGSLTPVKVEYAKAADLGFWTPKATNDPDSPAKNIGTYGDEGLEKYVYSKDPFLDKIVGDPLVEENKTEVLAKGIFGYNSDYDSGVKWYISTDGVLHLGSGVTNWVHEGDYFTLVNTDNSKTYVSPWYQYKDKFNKVSIDRNVIVNPGSQYLFSNLTEVTSYVGLENLDFTLDNPFVASYKDNGKGINLTGMFQNNSKLTEMSGEENWDLTYVKNMSKMFDGASALTSLDVSEWNTGAVTNMGSMFQNAKALLSLDTSEWDTKNVTSMSRMFNTAESLMHLDVSQWDTSKVTTLRTMFQNAKSLVKLDTSNWDTGQVTDMAYMFNGVSSLTSLDVSNWQTGAVTTMSTMFQNTKGLVKLDTSNWNTSQVTDMAYMFNGASALTSLDVSNWQTDAVTTMSTMFQNADSLNRLDMTNWDTNNVTDIRYMLASMDVLKEITIGEKFVTTKATSITPGALELPNDTAKLKWRNVADGTVAVPLGTEYIGDYRSGTNVADTYVLTDKVGAKIDYTDKSIIPEQVVATDYLSGLVGSAVSYDVLDPWRADLLKDIPYVYAGEEMSAFNYTPDPLSVTLTVDNTDNKVIPMKKIAEVTKLPTAMPEAIPETTPAKGIFGDVEWYIDLGGTLHFGEGTFGDMGTLTESPWKDYNDLIKTISFEGSVKANTSMSHLFANLTNVTAISGLAKIDVSATENMNGTFSNMTSLPVLDFSGWQTPNVTNMLNMLSGDTSLKEVTFGSSFVTPQVTTAETTGQLELPNDTGVIKWQNVAEGTVTEPLGEEFIGAYKSGTNVPDTYVLVNDTVTPNFPNTGSNLRLIALISASGMILFGLLGASWYKRKQNIE
ncbi:BspA family leucine-rich repeat surface protein [Enterococcus dongliensis]|uniref:BspA family leucine-rich repeat surface protein n=1 Tax=Enterococcus dongliensis TaxID=2559925 RepID=UPI00288E8D42|nr:BspA family leucine-rich repeat surface protein [Enterococcus dongliensis]MDT2712280.1 BspA family leucine-rich repeat surface protein [Enterococcus dongliensis]